MNTDASFALKTAKLSTMGKQQGISLQGGENTQEIITKERMNPSKSNINRKDIMELTQNLMQECSTGLKTVCPGRWQKEFASGDVKVNSSTQNQNGTSPPSGG